MPFNWLTSLFGSPAFNDYQKDAAKIIAVLTNPAMLKVIALQCDLFSLGKIYVYKDGKDLGPDAAIDRFNSPNPMQTCKQFLWDYMFYIMLGTDQCYLSSDVATNATTKMYHLQPSKLEWPISMERDKDKLIFSDQKYNDLMKTQLTYRYEDGTTFTFALSRLISTFDLSNALGNWWKSPSRIDALYKVISNSEAALDSTNINVRYSGKFMIAGTQNPNDTTKLPMGEHDKQDIEKKIDGDKPVHAVKSLIEIKRFVENMANLKLNEAYLDAYYIIGNMYNIPRDVLEAYQSSTFENQEKARASHVSYTLQPKGDDFLEPFAKRWGYTAEGKKLVISWDHLPFNQVFEKERAETKKNIATTFTMLIDQDVPLAEVNEFLDTNFSKATKNAKPTVTVAGQGNN